MIIKLAMFGVRHLIFLPLPELLTVQLHRLLLKLDRRKKVGNDIQTTFRQLSSFASAFKVKYGEFEVGLNIAVLRSWTPADS